MTLDDLQARRARMIDYLRLKLEENDMHGVPSAASDIREIDAQIKVIALVDPRRNLVYGNVIHNA